MKRLLAIFLIAVMPDAFYAAPANVELLQSLTEEKVGIEEIGLQMEADSISPGNSDPQDSVISIQTPVNVASGSPKITPVDIDRGRPQAPIMHYYDKHGNQLETPVRFLADLDTATVKVRPGAVFPAYNGVSVGLNFFDAIMMAAGQRRLSMDLWADISLWNWIFPTAEVGLGYANAWPNDGRCHIRTNPTLYAKVGFNYNFLYKSNPDYQVFLGFRAGYSGFHFSATDIQAGSDYYSASSGRNLYAIKTTAWYGQLVAGIKIKLYKAFSMGWTARYGFKFRVRTGREGVEPWFIPGYGTGGLNATYSLIFTFGTRPRRDATVNYQ